MMRLSTYIKRKYQKDGIIIARAIQDNSMVRLTVPMNTQHLKDEVRRMQAYDMFGKPVQKMWVWVWSGSPDWEDNLDRVSA